jgi:hypothetical protein
LARFLEDDRLAVFRPTDFRLRDREDDFRAELRPPFLADLVLRFAERRALFLVPFRAAFLPALLAEVLVAFLRLVPERRRPVEVPPPMPDSPRLLGEGSPKSNDDGVDEGVGEGVLSEGSGSIHPEPDQPISI